MKELSEKEKETLIAGLKGDPSKIRNASPTTIKDWLEELGWMAEYQENKKEDGELGEKPWQFLRRKLGLDK